MGPLTEAIPTRQMGEGVIKLVQSIQEIIFDRPCDWGYKRHYLSIVGKYKDKNKGKYSPTNSLNIFKTQVQNESDALQNINCTQLCPIMDKIRTRNVL